MRETVTFTSGSVDHYYDGFGMLDSIVPKATCIIITDSNIADLYKEQLAGYKTIVLPPGEEQKNIQTITSIAEKLVAYEAHRGTWLVGVGGGVITDITGFVAATYMRGVPFGFVPTTLLAMVDAAIGGKNGVDFGLQKNLLGTIRQPKFILQDASFLDTLPALEWSNGFAEVIKYGCIFDNALFDILEKNDLEYYRNHREALTTIISRCAAWKNKTVAADETETGVRKLLNFGHTAGHAIETVHSLPHGQAVALGMLIACIISEKVSGIDKEVRQRLGHVLRNYGLPVTCRVNIDEAMQVLKMDKKRNAGDVDFIVLEQIGTARIQRIGFDVIHGALIIFNDECNS
ncbi:MAG: 3-dehydroquinate synthase [Sphingobacteriales bacterium]|nr:MAG: 3-dehydroquinate synthase [Sphingobacteriales bacterium]